MSLRLARLTLTSFASGLSHPLAGTESLDHCKVCGVRLFALIVLSAIAGAGLCSGVLLWRLDEKFKSIEERIDKRTAQVITFLKNRGQ